MGLFGKMWNNFHVGTFVKACKFGDQSQVQMMLKEEPELAYSKDKGGISALFHAVANGHDKIVAILLKITNQANDVEPEKGFTPLLIAATNGHKEIVRLLLDHGADPNLRNYDGVTALHNAVYESQADVVALLLKAGADPNIKDRLGNSSADLAKRSGNPNIVNLM